jgi:Na+-transporting methylmalonyl-CoA/oxaloacetate decarboxylase gamma subunit
MIFYLFIIIFLMQFFSRFSNSKIKKITEKIEKEKNLLYFHFRFEIFIW